MFKIDKTLVDNMNINKSCIVITHKETAKKPPKPEKMTLNDDSQLPAEIRDKAMEFVQSANVKAQQIIANALAEAEEIKEEARRQGVTDGMSEARDKHDEQVKDFRDNLLKLEKYRDSLFEALQSDILDLSVDIAEKIINIVIEKDDTAYKGLVKNAVESLKKADKFVLYVSRGDYDKFFKDSPPWILTEAGSAEPEVICDASLKRGDCIIESDKEIVDAGISRQLSKARQHLKEQVD
ncbi:MAG: FliH/SctL family protein [Christensenellales bacterium]